MNRDKGTNAREDNWQGRQEKAMTVRGWKGEKSVSRKELFLRDTTEKSERRNSKRKN